MAEIEGVPQPGPGWRSAEMTIGDWVRPYLLSLADRLARPGPGLQERLDLVERMRHAVQRPWGELKGADAMQR
jgi:hypothetical protein